MPKTYIRTLWAGGKIPLWFNEDTREGLRRYLNDQGFYVLTGAGDSLEVYVIDYTEALDIRLAKKALDKFKKAWYTLISEEA